MTSRNFTAYDFLISLGARGLSLFMRDDRVTVAPGILLTDEDQVALWRHERALLAILQLREAAATCEHPACPGVVQMNAKIRQLHGTAEKIVGERLTFDGRRRRECF
jgi:hypothetical protein